MLISCWSVKGGSGTTVVAASLALLLARSSPGVVLADLAGDVPTVLGMEEPEQGIVDWLAAGPEVAEDGLTRLVEPVGDDGRLGVLPRAGKASGATGWWSGPLDGSDGRLMTALAGLDAPAVVVDCGSSVDRGAPFEASAGAGLSLLVIRPCYVALKRALACPLRPSAIVLVDEPGRAFGREVIEDVMGVPVRAVVPWEVSVARAVDAGLLRSALPRPLSKNLGAAA